MAVLPPTSVVKAQFAALLREGGGSTTDLDVLDCTGAEIPLLCSLLTRNLAALGGAVVLWWWCICCFQTFCWSRP